MIKKDILSTPKHGWCNFHLADEEKEFNAALSYLTDVMYDTLKMCLVYLQTGAGAAAVMYDREGEGTFLFVISDYDVYIWMKTCLAVWYILKTCGQTISAKTSLAAIIQTPSAGLISRI